MKLSQSDLELLVDVSRILSSKLDTDELLKTIMEMASRVVKSEASSLLLLDEKTNELTFNVALGDKSDHVKEIRLKVGEGIAGWVAQEKKPVIVNDAAQDPRWTSKADDKSKFKTRNILAVPLMAKGRLIGVVEAINQMHNEDFSEADQRVFEAFASQAAIAIENAHLFKRLKEEKEKIEMVFSEMSDGALMIDELGKTILCNDGACKLLGFGNVSYASRKISDLVEGFDVIPPIDLLIKKQDKVFPIEFSRSKGKTLILQGMVNRLTSDDNEVIGFLAVFRDVTGEKREEKLKRNFLSLISHKLKTPLVSIAGYIPLLLEEATAMSDFQVKALKTMKNQTDKLTLLVEKLLSFTLMEAESFDLKKKIMPLHIVINESLMHLKTYLAEKKVTVEKHESLKQMRHVNIDPEYLREVLKDILENAVKFNAKPDKKVSISAHQNDEAVFLTIEDNGPGIPSEEHEKIFNKFYQIEENFTGQVEGAGLGLALAKMIITAHDGSISVRSKLGKGTAFILRFSTPVSQTG